VEEAFGLAIGATLSEENAKTIRFFFRAEVVTGRFVATDASGLVRAIILPEARENENDYEERERNSP
jgi:hypothetical protein